MWQVSKKALEAAKETEAALRNELFAITFPAGLVGTDNYELGQGYKLKGVGKINYNLNNKDGATEKALGVLETLGNEGTFIAERLVSWKPTLSVTEYKSLSADSPYKRIIDAVLTTSPGLPTLELVEPKAKK
jgi:hypothetical protein